MSSEEQTEAEIPRKNGRPPEPVPAVLAEEVIEWVSDGKLLVDYCDQEGKVHRRTISKWCAKDKEFRARFARARDDGFDVMAERMMAKLLGDAPKDSKGRIDPGMVQHLRNQAHHQLQLLSRWSVRYRDRVAVGGDSDAPPIVMTDVERKAKLDSLFERVAARVGSVDSETAPVAESENGDVDEAGTSTEGSDRADDGGGGGGGDGSPPQS